jgi:hypothetical protein
MNWEIRTGGTVDLSVDRDEFAIIALCLSRAKHVLEPGEIERSLKSSPEDLDSLSWDLSEAQGDYHRNFGGGPEVELS